MEHLKEYNEYLFEKKGISPAIYNSLELFFDSVKRPSYKDAKAFIAKTNDGWDLSEEDYNEAKAKFKSQYEIRKIIRRF